MPPPLRPPSSPQARYREHVYSGGCSNKKKEDEAKLKERIDRLEQLVGGWVGCVERVNLKERVEKPYTASGRCAGGFSWRGCEAGGVGWGGVGSTPARP